jgi:hypothetical protein
MPMRPGVDAIYEVLRRAMRDDPQLLERKAEEVSKELVRSGYLHDEPAGALVAGVLRDVEAGERRPQSRGPRSAAPDELQTAALRVGSRNLEYRKVGPTRRPELRDSPTLDSCMNKVEPKLGTKRLCRALSTRTGIRTGAAVVVAGISRDRRVMDEEIDRARLRAQVWRDNRHLFNRNEGVGELRQLSKEELEERDEAVALQMGRALLRA